MDRVKREKPELVQKIIDGGLSSRAAEQIMLLVGSPTNQHRTTSVNLVQHR
jgi:hypothetical protein